MVKLSKREELIFAELSKFRDFVIQKQNEIKDCNFDVVNGSYTFGINWGEYQIVKPTGEKQVKVCVHFGSPSPENVRGDVVDYIREFVENIQEGLVKKEIEIYRFITNLDLDLYSQVEIDYRWVTTDAEN